MMNDAKNLLSTIKGMVLLPTERIELAIKLAALMLEASKKFLTKKEKKRYRMFARMLEDPSGKGKALITAITDSSFRSQDPKVIVAHLQQLLQTFGTPSFLDLPSRCALFIFRTLGHLAPAMTTKTLLKIMRKETQEVILPGEEEELVHHLKKRAEEGVQVNLNRLGEAILGEEEAVNRLNRLLQDLKNPYVPVISVKISSIYSQINLVAYDQSLNALKERLRLLYRESKKHTPHKLVHLDMEEYKDLRLTYDLFTSTLDEPEFLDLTAGIVLQSYIPDSFAFQKRLTDWALKRKQNGGEPIYLRIVKGANLAMEQVEASIKGWPQAPYLEKESTDANFKKMCAYGFEEAHVQAIHLGIATHNLFDIAYALVIRAEKKLEPYVGFEMLEGMANHLRRVVQELSGSMLLYCPATKKKDFHTSVAYLMRRLDENTHKDNFLPHLFGLKQASPAWNQQAEFFQKSVSFQSTDMPRRIQNRFETPLDLEKTAPFTNEPDTDFSLEENRLWAASLFEKAKLFQLEEKETIPCVIGASTLVGKNRGRGIDPSRPHFFIHSYALAEKEDIDRALDCGKKSTWQKVDIKKKSSLFKNVAKVLRQKRGLLLQAMLSEVGKNIQEADSEVSEAIDMAEYYARVLEEHPGGGVAPGSVALVITPWNFPCSIPASGILASLACGYSVIFKPSEEAVLVGYRLLEAFYEGGIPKDALQYLMCKDEPEGSYLVCHPSVSTVVMTGATTTARHFLKMCPQLKLFAETGGKNSIIVSKLSDRDLAVRDIIQSSFGYSGQKCSACSLVICDEEVYHDKQFLFALRDAAKSLKVGTSWDLATKVGPLIRDPSPHLLRALTTLEKGESWLVEPTIDPENQKLVSPGIKLGVSKGSFTHQTEFFGPIIGLMCAKNLAEAIDLANATPYGLTAGLHSLDEREQALWLDKIEAGNCYINRGITGAIVARQPFGGCKGSSFGIGMKGGGPNYLLELFQSYDTSFESAPFPQRGASSYQYYWETYFSKVHQLCPLVGQENYLFFRPHPLIYLFLQESDEMRDIALVLACAKTTGTKLILGGTSAIKPYGLECTQSIEEFTKRIATTPAARIRAFSNPPARLCEEWAKNMCVLDVAKPATCGRYELLHFVREISVSHDYHRYGNLMGNFSRSLLAHRRA